MLPTVYLGPVHLESIPTPDGWMIRALQEYKFSVEPEYQGPALTWKPRIGAEEPKEDQ